MRHISKIFKISVCIILFTTSCSNDFLETEPLSEFSEIAVWNDPALVETFINDLYARLDENMTEGRLKACLVDEADYRGHNSTKTFNNSLITSDYIPSWPLEIRYRSWDDLYKSIRSCNIFFDKIENVPFDDNLIDGKTLKDRMTGEVYFLRACFYHELVSLYGGVPIIKNVYQLTDDFKIERNTYSDCVKFMVEECDKAASLLPEVNTGNNKGRATKGAALSLKSIILLYAASDLHNTTVFPGYQYQELIRYTDENRNARWQAAKDAAKAVIDMNLYSLYKADPGPNDSIAENIAELFLLKETEEDIFVKYFTTESGLGQKVGLYTNPNGYHGWGSNAPIGELVDDIEMADGSRFDWSNPAHAAEPYRNRDQRFYANVLYEGAKWRKRPDDVIGIDPYGIIQVGCLEKWDAETNNIKYVYGIDSRQGSVEDWNGSYTGYYNRKFIDPDVDAQYAQQAVTWRFIRYGEILLNYAEACIELGEDAEACKYINMIRKRAGQPSINESGDALRARYRNERRVEMMFEDQRFFDVRRWVIGPEAYKPVHGVKVLYKLNSDHSTATVPTITPYEFQTRAWIDKAYFLPIYRSEINKNDLLIQNPNY